MRQALPLLAGWLLIVEHGSRLVFVIIATTVALVLPVSPEVLEQHRIQWWTVYYGTITTLIEAPLLMALAVLLLRKHPRARPILLWVLPIVVVHDIAHSIYIIDLPLQGAVFSSALDILAWVALLAARPRELTEPARP